MDKTRIAHHYDTLDEEKVARRYIEAHQAMKEALEAVVARIDGTYDHPSLVKQGPLSIGHNDDVRRIAKHALALANGKDKES